MRVMGDCAFLHCPPIINIESKSNAFIQQTSLTLTLSGRMWMCIFQTGTTESPWSAGGQRAGRQTVNWTCSDIQWRRNQVPQVCTVDSSNLFKLRVSLLWCVQPVGECTDIRTVAYPWKKKINHTTIYTHSVRYSNLIFYINSRTVTWKFSIDGEKVSLLYRTVHRVQTVLKIWGK